MAAVKTPREALSDVPFDRASSIVKYFELMRKIGRELQLELETGAEELNAVLVTSGGSVFDKFAARVKARKIAKEIRRAAEDAKYIAVSGVRARKIFETEYQALLQPDKKKAKTFDWTS